MAQSIMYDPGTMEARSPWLAGLTEICNKMSGVLGMNTTMFRDLTLSEVYISEKDRCRIYQAPLGNKLWLQEPAPVIKKNGRVIRPETDNFEIDYIGGSIAFSKGYTLSPQDIVTASATYILDSSAVIDAFYTQIDDLKEKLGNFKGNFSTLQDLESTYSVGNPGDYAVVQEGDTIYIWSDTSKAWIDVHKGVDLSDYFTKSQIDTLLAKKENTISAKGNKTTDDIYYYGGRKSWVNLADKVLTVALTGLNTSNNTSIQAKDTFIEAFGKLQAQIDSKGENSILSGYGAPTEDTAGEIGQDYVDSSNGDKYHLIDVGYGGSGYIWEKYADETSLKDYVDKSIRTAVLNAWKKNY